VLDRFPQINRRRRRPQAIDPCLGFYPASLHDHVYNEIKVVNPDSKIRNAVENFNEQQKRGFLSPNARAPEPLAFLPTTSTNHPTQEHTPIAEKEPYNLDETLEEPGKEPDIVSADAFLKSYRCRKYGKRKREIVTQKDDNESCSSTPESHRPTKRKRGTRNRDDDNVLYYPNSRNPRTAKRTKRETDTWRRKLPLAERLLRASIRCGGDPVDELVRPEAVESLPFTTQLDSRPPKDKRRKWTLVDSHTAPSMTASFISTRERDTVQPNSAQRPLSKWPSVCHSFHPIQRNPDYAGQDKQRPLEPSHKKRKPLKAAFRIFQCSPLKFVPLYEERSPPKSTIMQYDALL